MADIAIALVYTECYPEYLNDKDLEDRLKSSEFEVKVLVPVEIAETLDEFIRRKKFVTEAVTSWIRVDLSKLIRIIKDVAEYFVREQDLADMIAKIEDWINDFTSTLRSIDTNMAIAGRMYDIFYKLYGLSIGDLRDVQELLYAKAGLTLLLSSVLYQSIRAYYGFDDMDTLARRYGSRLRGLMEAFKLILTKDYREVYEVALEVASILPNITEERIEYLIDLSTQIASKRILLRKDFSGKVYHRIVGEWSVKKGFATYYTSIPAAWLLAYLTIFTPTGVFEKLPSDPEALKVVDFACGSGTLLTASYAALQDRYIEDLLEKFSSDKFHRSCVEKVFWGFDALKYAVQITATNLVLQNPAVPITRMNTYTLPVGLMNNKVKLGSLEFLKGLTPYMLEARKVSVSEDEEVILREITPRSIHLIIMNPPFTRATGRRGRRGGGLFGFIVDRELREKVVDDYESLRRDVKNNLASIGKRYVEGLPREVRDEFLSIGQAGEGLLFLYLASKYVASNGKIAFVLPKTLLTGSSWFLARTLLLDKFQLEYVVVSYDADEGYNFSESTSLSETLIVARAKNRGETSGREPTRFVVLLKKPATSLEARGLAYDILDKRGELSSYIQSNSANGWSYSVSEELLVKHLENWGRLAAFPDPYLTSSTLEVFDGYLIGRNIPIRRLGGFAKIGIDAHQFHDQFSKAPHDTPGTYPCIYGGEEERRLTMLTEPNARMTAKSSKAVETFHVYSSYLLVPDRIRVDTAHVVALYCTEPVLSNIFYAVRLDGGEKEMKALALWLNTTWGVLSTLANRSETEGGWIRLKMTHWKLQPVLDVESLDRETLSRLSEVFDRYSQSRLRRLPEQFYPENPDPIRRSIDIDFLRALGVTIDEHLLLGIYRGLYESLITWLGSPLDIDRTT
ncbi:MAG: hypothetical protein RMJ00_00250 [Nitrososphaerota archaeon]|nr:hypothetical protein [Candidatus Bathyarchaeota archaeon]MCX8161903.1 hypothetical protein [Candidatus Bathyarchaeota archaeon]MDW8061123.1 hypothetical protein [Nitrososphaerota archaeon]